MPKQANKVPARGLVYIIAYFIYACLMALIGMITAIGMKWLWKILIGI